MCVSASHLSLLVSIMFHKVTFTLFPKTSMEGYTKKPEYHPRCGISFHKLSQHAQPAEMNQAAWSFNLNRPFCLSSLK